MNRTLRASLATALTVLCFSAHAEVNRNCVTTLEAQPSNPPPKPSTSTKKPCPVAVAYGRHARSTPRADLRDLETARIARSPADAVARA